MKQISLYDDILQNLHPLMTVFRLVHLSITLFGFSLVFFSFAPKVYTECFWATSNKWALGHHVLSPQAVPRWTKTSGGAPLILLTRRPFVASSAIRAFPFAFPSTRGRPRAGPWAGPPVSVPSQALYLQPARETRPPKPIHPCKRRTHLITPVTSPLPQISRSAPLRSCSCSCHGGGSGYAMTSMIRAHQWLLAAALGGRELLDFVSCFVSWWFGLEKGGVSEMRSNKFGVLWGFGAERFAIYLLGVLLGVGWIFDSVFGELTDCCNWDRKRLLISASWVDCDGLS